MEPGTEMVCSEDTQSVPPLQPGQCLGPMEYGHKLLLSGPKRSPWKGQDNWLPILGGDGQNKMLAGPPGRESCPRFATGETSVRPFFPGPSKLIGTWHRNRGCSHGDMCSCLLPGDRSSRSLGGPWAPGSGLGPEQGTWKQ